MDRKRWEHLKKSSTELMPIRSQDDWEDTLKEIEADLYITDEKKQEEDVEIDYSHFFITSDTWRCKICGRGKNNSIHTKE